MKGCKRGWERHFSDFCMFVTLLQRRSWRLCRDFFSILFKTNSLPQPNYSFTILLYTSVTQNKQSFERKPVCFQHCVIWPKLVSQQGPQNKAASFVIHVISYQTWYLSTPWCNIWTFSKQEYWFLGNHEHQKYNITQRTMTDGGGSSNL